MTLFSSTKVKSIILLNLITVVYDQIRDPNPLIGFHREIQIITDLKYGGGVDVLLLLMMIWIFIIFIFCPFC
ncbi:hypothetical protein ACSBR2_024223 [Camellia fascicularis]